MPEEAPGRRPGGTTPDDVAAAFEAERPRLTRIARSVLGDATEAEDVVQAAWLRLQGTDAVVENLPGWLTTVTTRLCLDRLRMHTPVPVADEDLEAPTASAADPVDEVVLAETVGAALHVVLDQLTPGERVAFVLHDSFGVDFATIAEILGRSPEAARKLASRARGKVAQPVEPDERADWVVVDAFLEAARGGDLTRLLQLLAPDVVVLGDAAAVALGTPTRIEGREEVAGFFDGSASAALSAYVDGRPGAAWWNLGAPRVAFDFTVEGGVVTRLDFRADPGLLATVTRRRGSDVR